MPVDSIPARTTSGSHVFATIWKAFRALMAQAEVSKKRVGLGNSEFRVLEALLHQGPLPISLIGNTVDLTTGSITSAIDRLEAKWLVIRKNHPEDRRIRLVELTLKGRRLIKKADAQHAFDMETAVGALSREDRAKLVDLLEHLCKDFASDTKAAPPQKRS